MNGYSPLATSVPLPKATKSPPGSQTCVIWSPSLPGSSFARTLPLISGSPSVTDSDGSSTASGPSSSKLTVISALSWSPSASCTVKLTVTVSSLNPPGSGFSSSWSSGLSCLRSEEHTSELQSLMRISSAVLCLNTNIQDQ